MKATLLFLIFFVAVAVATDVKEYDTVEVEWEKFKKNFNKHYTEEEEAKRLAIFTATYKKVQEHNEKYKKGEVTWTLGINEFADLTQEEFASTHTMQNWADKQKKDGGEQYPNLHGLVGH